MVAPLYRGFSSVANQGIDTRLYDAELVKQDLLNNFSTRLGERVGRPGFGSIIHDLLFSLSDDRTKGLVVADAQRIFADDPRVVPLEINVDVLLDEYQIRIQATLQMVELDMNINFQASFEARG